MDITSLLQYLNNISDWFRNILHSYNISKEYFYNKDL